MTEFPYYQQLKSFFDFKLENEAKEQFVSNNKTIQAIPESCIKELVDIPLSFYVDYIRKCCKRVPIEASDVFQFSKFEDATLNICKAVLLQNNPGLTNQELGKMLLTDGKSRSVTALNKYGENHIKTAELFGLAFRGERYKYYLSSMGVVFAQLSDALRERLFVRLVLRNKLMSQLILSASKGTIELDAFLYDLSQSTYKRRRTNIKYMIKLLCQIDEFDFLFLETNIMM